MFIRAVNGRFGGASHDSHVWSLSDERKYLMDNFQRGDKTTRILGEFFFYVVKFFNFVA